jgi:hypothetical protein
VGKVFITPMREMGNSYKIFVEKHEEKTLIGRRKLRRENDIKNDS